MGTGTGVGAGTGVGTGTGRGEGWGTGAGEGGGGGGAGGATPPVQSVALGAAQHAKSGCADGHVEPSGQQELPAQPAMPSGHRTGSPTPQLVSDCD